MYLKMRLRACHQDNAKRFRGVSDILDLVSLTEMFKLIYNIYSRLGHIVHDDLR